jgi:hypothetical protein
MASVKQEHVVVPSIGEKNVVESHNAQLKEVAPGVRLSTRPSKWLGHLDLLRDTIAVDSRCSRFTVL